MIRTLPWTVHLLVSDVSLCLFFFLVFSLQLLLATATGDHSPTFVKSITGLSPIQWTPITGLCVLYGALCLSVFCYQFTRSSLSEHTRWNAGHLVLTNLLGMWPCHTHAGNHNISCHTPTLTPPPPPTLTGLWHWQTAVHTANQWP